MTSSSVARPVTVEPLTMRPVRRIPVAVLASAVGCWLVSLSRVDLRSMTDVGLVSVLPIEFYLALVLLTVGFVVASEHHPDRSGLLGGYLLALVAVIHATPALLYGTVRYSWSWKHLGVVDFIQRTGEVDPDARFLDIYHGWPGLFGLTALISEATGIEARTLALWAPVAFSLLALLALAVLFRSLVDDPRIVWSGMWIYVLGNWVGQEYFSPQGFTFALYLAALALALPLEHRRDPGREPMVRTGLGPAPSTRSGVRAARIAVVLAVATIAASHQLTPIMVVVTFGVAAAVRASRTAWVAAAGLGLMLVWLAGPASTYFAENTLGLVETLGSPSESSSSSFADAGAISDGQVAVVVADRFLTYAIVVLAGIGVVSWWLHRRRVELLCAAAAAPVVLLVTDYGGEVLFRAYMFAVPWLAICAAIALVGRSAPPSSTVSLVARTAILLVLLAAFLFAYLGKERANYFTRAEVDLVTQLYEEAPPNSLLIEGSRNYPGSSLEYEKFFYVPIDREPRTTHARIDANPVDELYRWMSDEEYDAHYLVITRSQKLAELGVSTMPSGMLDRIETALSRSSRFRVVLENDDAVVFTTVPEPE